MNAKKISERCLWCGKNDLRQWVIRKDGINIVECQTCGLRQLEEIPKEIAKLYDKNYFEKCKINDSNNNAEIGYSNYHGTLLHNFLWQYAYLKLVSDPCKGDLLDIGCASGKFLELAEMAGFSATGIDISREAIEIANNKGLIALLSPLEQLKADDEKFQVITAWDLIEHLENLREFLSEVNRILKDGGVFIFSTPDAGAKIAEEKKNLWIGYITSLEHVSFFTQDFLNRAFKEIFKSVPQIYSFTYGEYSTIIGYVRKGGFNQHDELLYSYFEEIKNNKKIDASNDTSFLLALIYINFGFESDNEKIIPELIESIGSNYQRFLLGSLFDLKNGNYRSAIQLLQEISKRCPKDSVIWQIFIEALQKKCNRSDSKISGKNDEIKKLTEQFSILDSVINTKNEQIEKLNDHVSTLENQINKKTEEVNQIASMLRQRENSLSWKFSQWYGNYFDINSSVTRIAKHCVNRLVNKPDEKDVYRLALKDILKEYEGKIKGIIIYPPTVDWNIPLFQRPQQLALGLSKLDYLFFYCTPNYTDGVNGFKIIKNNCYLTNQYEFLLKNLKNFAFLFSSTNKLIKLEDVLDIKSDMIIIYDYIDEIHCNISGKELIDEIVHRHNYLIENSDIVIATADKLLEKVMETRSSNVHLVPNGVNYEHFRISRNRKDIPLEIKQILNKKHPIIGYYGALATWLDYELIKYIAENRPEYEIIIIGWDYDGSIQIQDLDKFENIHYLGVKKYDVLPNYAIWFDVSIIPFILNEVTESTSPIKIFEYMALGTPIVTTDLRECRKYESVLIGKDYEDFVKKVDIALKLRDNKDYLELLDKEAVGNTWEKRARSIDTLIMKIK
jgi:teichuronic acid biosynthesis glycosyltransferase TuaH